MSSKQAWKVNSSYRKLSQIGKENTASFTDQSENQSLYWGLDRKILNRGDVTDEKFEKTLLILGPPNRKMRM